MDGEDGGHIVVLITVGSEGEATRIARDLVEQGLAACVNILPRMRSLYPWEGRLCDEEESLLLVKTQARAFARLARRVKQLHSYTLPEIIALPITHGSIEYLGWIDQLCSGQSA